MGCPCSCQAGWRVVLGKDAMQIRSFLLAAAGGLMLAACSQPEELPPAAAAPPPPPPGAVAGSVAADRDGDGIIDGYYTADGRSEEHTSELQSLMRISYAVFCLKKQTQQHDTTTDNTTYTMHIFQ